MDLDVRPKREHEGFDQGDLGCPFHVDDDVLAPGTIYEVRRIEKKDWGVKVSRPGKSALGLVESLMR